MAKTDRSGEDHQWDLLLPQVEGAGDTVVTPPGGLSLMPAYGILVPIEGYERPKTIFPFLLLPAGIRLIIYTDLFMFDEPVCPTKPNRYQFYYWFQAPRSLINLAFAMMRVNKQLWNEVTQFLYNKFLVSTNSSLKTIGERNKSFLRHVILDCAAVPREVDKQVPRTLFRNILDTKTAVASARTLKEVPKPDFDGLRTLTFYDRWKSLGRTAVPGRLLRIGKYFPWWKMFPKLESMQFDVDATKLIPEEMVYYEEICFRSRVKVTAGTTQLVSPTPQRFRLTLTPADMDRNPRFAAEIEARQDGLAARRPESESPKVISPQISSPKSSSPKGIRLESKSPVGDGGRGLNRRAVCDSTTRDSAEPTTSPKCSGNTSHRRKQRGPLLQPSHRGWPRKYNFTTARLVLTHATDTPEPNL